MVSSCCVPRCKNVRVKQANRHIKFYRLPKYNIERKTKWIQAIGRGDDWMPSDFSRVCSEHFVLGEKSDNKLSPNYVPCIFDHTTPIEMRKLLRLFDTHNKEVVEKVGKISVTTALLSLVEGREVEDETEESSSAAGTKNSSVEEQSEDNYFSDSTTYNSDRDLKDQDTQTLLLDSYLKSLEDEYYKLKSELSLVKDKDIFRDMELRMFQYDDVKVKYLTGLSSYDMLKVLSEYIGTFQKDQSKLSKFQQLMITLIKIKLNLPMPFLGILFNISLTTISRVFRYTIDLLFKTVVPSLIFWPSKDELKRLIPSHFEYCESCLYSVDYFELDVEMRGCTTQYFKERLDGLDAYFSNSLVDARKRKFIMSVAPQGTILFISQGANGIVSDRALAADSGFLNHIASDDVVVTEQGIDIEGEVDLRGGMLEFTQDITDDNTKLVNVKDVVSSMKRTFRIMDAPVLCNWVKDNDQDGYCSWDKILQVVCALFNMTNEVEGWNYRDCLRI